MLNPKQKAVLAIAQKSPDKLTVQDEGLKGTSPSGSALPSFSGNGKFSKFKGKKKGGGLDNMPSPATALTNSSSILQ